MRCGAYFNCYHFIALNRFPFVPVPFWGGQNKPKPKIRRIYDLCCSISFVLETPSKASHNESVIGDNQAMVTLLHNRRTIAARSSGTSLATSLIPSPLNCHLRARTHGWSRRGQLCRELYAYPDLPANGDDDDDDDDVSIQWQCSKVKN